jgi:3',5'-cyclic AMP phosphodiesterase CpdA
VRTAILSDLHLGSSFGEDLLRDDSLRRVLLDEIAAADRVVLLGDALELRELPLPAVLAAARTFFEELGETMAGREVLIVPGNHDHRLAEPLLEDAAMSDGDRLDFERRAAPAQGPTSAIAAWLGGARLSIAYPGVWLRDDVYATHGHYMDCHMSLPRIECIAAAAVMRAFGPVPARATPGDYERVLRPVYGLSFGLAQAGLARRASRPSEGAWRRISGRDRARSPIRRAAVRAAVSGGVPATVWALNRMLRADFDADLSAAAITRSGIDAATELERRLALGAAHVVTGHTHRAGPETGEADWPLAGGGRLHNTGSWVFASAFHHPGTPPGPYWPGTLTWVEDEGPPRRVRLLDRHPREALKDAVRKGAAEADRRVLSGRPKKKRRRSRRG